MTPQERAEIREACLDAAVADFYASGGWTAERRARFAPIWAETQRLKALKADAEPAELEAPAEPAAA